MADTAIEVKKSGQPTASAAVSRAPDVWNSLRNEMESVFDRFSGSFGMPSLRRMFDFEPVRRSESAFTLTVPAVDVTENRKAYTLTAELPGMEAGNIEVTINGDIMSIKGEKHEEKEEKDSSHYLCERSFGSFHRTFSIPAGVDRDKISADLSKGILTVTLPKTAEAQQQQKKVEVKAS